MSLSWLFLAGIAVAVYVRMRARVVVHIAEGRARVVRGRLPAGVVEDLRAVASLTPGVRGRVELRGKGPTLSVRTPGLPDGVGQRARNVVHLRRNDV
ncbi:MAG: hypothetical protein ACK4YP_14455 [Myxococcota bacterium]